MSTTMKMITSEMMNVGLRRSSPHASLQRLRGLPWLRDESSTWLRSPTADAAALSSPAPPAAGSLIADPGVQNGVQRVDDQAHQQVDEDEHRAHAGPGDALLLLDAPEDQPADA